MGVHRRSAGERGPGARAAADGFVILVGGVAEGQVVHRALGPGHEAERAEQRVGHVLAGLHIAGHHRGGVARVQHAALGHDEPQRLEAAAVQRNVGIHQAAEDIEQGRHGDRLRRVVIAFVLRAGAGEVDGRGARGAVDGDCHRDFRAVVHLVGEGAALQRIDHAAHALLGIILHMAHIGAHHIEAVLRHHAAQLLRAFFISGDLRLEVGHILRRVARRPLAGAEQRHNLGYEEAAAIHQLHSVEQHAFLVPVPRVGRHRAGREAADIGMVAARRDMEQQVLLRCVEHRGDHGDVGQVGAAGIGRIQHEHVARANAAGAPVDDGADALAHAAEVHRHVRRIGDEFALAVENGAGEIETFLDVDGIGGLFQHRAHLLGNRHEQVVENFQHHGVDRGADGDPRR